MVWGQAEADLEVNRRERTPAAATAARSSAGTPTSCGPAGHHLQVRRPDETRSPRRRLRLPPGDDGVRHDVYSSDFRARCARRARREAANASSSRARRQRAAQVRVHRQPRTRPARGSAARARRARAVAESRAGRDPLGGRGLGRPDLALPAQAGGGADPSGRVAGEGVDPAHAAQRSTRSSRSVTTTCRAGRGARGRRPRQDEDRVPPGDLGADGRSADSATAQRRREVEAHPRRAHRRRRDRHRPRRDLHRVRDRGEGALARAPDAVRRLHERDPRVPADRRRVPVGGYEAGYGTRAPAYRRCSIRASSGSASRPASASPSALPRARSRGTARRLDGHRRPPRAAVAEVHEHPQEPGRPGDVPGRPLEVVGSPVRANV